MSDQTSNAEGSYNASATPGGLDRELERLRQQALMVWGKEARTLSLFGLKDGMSLLELGGGPGFVTEQLLAMLPNSRITVVERDPVLIARAEQYLKSKGDERLRIIEASVMDTRLPENSFDFAYGRYLFQHLPDPIGAAREVLRVLKPGGKLVICDIDEKSHIFEPDAPPDIQAIFARFREEHEAKGGSRYRGRKLIRILREAGYTKFDMEAITAHSDIFGLDALGQIHYPDAWKPDLEAGRINQQEYEALTNFDNVFFSSDPIVVLIIYLACGEKTLPE